MTSLLFSDASAADNADTSESTATTALPPELSPQKMMFDNVGILIALFAIFYFILIRPQQKRIKMHQDLVKGLEKNQKVITNGGLIGTIAKFEGEDVVVIEIAQGVKVRIARSAISEVVTGTAGGESANDN